MIVNLLMVVFDAHRSGDGRFSWLIYTAVILLVAGTVVMHRWPMIVQLVRGIEGRDWPTVPAVIDRFDVIEKTETTKYGQRVYGYLTTLQYVYHNPEIQIGEYNRLMDSQDEAEAWASSFKDCTVMVHVDPRDPGKSVLRKEELEKAAFPAEPKVTRSESPSVRG